MKKILRYLKCPGGVFLLLLYVVTIGLIAAALTLAFTNSTQTILAYILYALSAIFLSYSVYTLVIAVPKAKASIVEKLQAKKFSSRLICDYKFRVIFYACVSVSISVAYAIFNGIVGIVDFSIWFGSLAGYYFMLATLRGSVLISHKKYSGNTHGIEQKKQKLSILCGIVLISTILALSVVISEMVSSNESFQYAGLMIYVGAAYTFTKVIFAIVNFAKAKKYNDTTIETIRNISLADASVSILALQTAMFSAFADGQNMAYANASTGAVVCFLILSLGVFMIIRASIKLKALKREVKNEKQD